MARNGLCHGQVLDKELTMLKISERQEKDEGPISLILEGRLAGPWVGEADLYWGRIAAAQRSHAAVDLSGLTFVDADGKALLTRMWQDGARLSATGCLMRCLVEEITGKGQKRSDLTKQCSD
ncbi:hypothetical protein W02_24110 [Nitrospira sp. KM1]|nr:hypothetical protein W02_24110 [Nitrospira sp. KM1]